MGARLSRSCGCGSGAHSPSGSPSHHNGQAWLDITTGIRSTDADSVSSWGSATTPLPTRPSSPAPTSPTSPISPTTCPTACLITRYTHSSTAAPTTPAMQHIPCCVPATSESLVSEPSATIRLTSIKSMLAERQASDRSLHRSYSKAELGVAAMCSNSSSSFSSACGAGHHYGGASASSRAASSRGASSRGDSSRCSREVPRCSATSAGGSSPCPGAARALHSHAAATIVPHLGPGGLKQLARGVSQSQSGSTCLLRAAAEGALHARLSSHGQAPAAAHGTGRHVIVTSGQSCRSGQAAGQHPAASEGEITSGFLSSEVAQLFATSMSLPGSTARASSHSGSGVIASGYHSCLAHGGEGPTEGQAAAAGPPCTCTCSHSCCSAGPEVGLAHGCGCGCHTAGTAGTAHSRAAAAAAAADQGRSSEELQGLAPRRRGEAGRSSGSSPLVSEQSTAQISGTAAATGAAAAVSSAVTGAWPEQAGCKTETAVAGLLPGPAGGRPQVLCTPTASAAAAATAAAEHKLWESFCCTDGM